jgi:hypothetical protein
VEKRGEVFWCFAGSMDFSSEDLSGEGASPLFGSTVGKAFISVKESVRGGIFIGGGGESNQLGSPGKGLFPGR